MLYQNPKAKTMAVLFLSQLSVAVYAADPLHLHNVSPSILQKTFHLTLQPKLKFEPGVLNNLQFVKRHTDKYSVTHVRMQQEYLGFPVFGGYAIVHAKRPISSLMTTQSSVRMNGVVYQHLKKDLGPLPAKFVEQGKQALQQFQSQFQTHTIRESQMTPMVYIDENQQAFWAYKLSLLIQENDQMPERPSAIVDAQTRVPYVQWNDLKTEMPVAISRVKGMGFGGNSKSGLVHYGEKLPYLLISRDNTTGICTMNNQDVMVVDMAYRYIEPNNPMAFNCSVDRSNLVSAYWTGRQNDGYDRENGAYSPSNDALYIGTMIHHMYQQWYGIDPLAMERNAKPLIMRVHYGKNFDNAFWDGMQMTFGDGNARMYPLVSLGIGGHEIAHGFTQQNSDLNYFGQSGAINESFSDMAAQALEFYVSGQNSWRIGAEILKKQSRLEALRFMDTPSRDGHSIERADQYQPDLNVHHASGVFNHLFYALSHRPNWDTHKAFSVMLKANMDYWTPYSTFEDAACGIIYATQDLKYSVNDVQQVLDDVVVDYQHCE